MVQVSGSASRGLRRQRTGLLIHRWLERCIHGESETRRDTIRYVIEKDAGVARQHFDARALTESGVEDRFGASAFDVKEARRDEQQIDGFHV